MILIRSSIVLLLALFLGRDSNAMPLECTWLLSADGITSTGASNVFDYIIGNLDINQSQRGKHTASFTPKTPRASLMSVSDGSRIVRDSQIISHHYAPHKSVLTELQISDFMQSLENGSYMSAKGVTHPVRVSVVTSNAEYVAEYGGHLFYEDPSTKSHFVVKSKYETSISAGRTSLTLDMIGYAGSFEGLTKRISIAITKKQTDSLKSLHLVSGNLAKYLTKLSDDISSLKGEDLQLLNSKEEVDALFKILSIMLNKDQSVLIPQFVVGYSRTSYQIKTGHSVFDINFDRGVKSYEYDPRVSTALVSQYAAHSPLFEAENNHIFTQFEERSGLRQANHNNFWNYMSSELDKHHDSQFKDGGSKYVVARHIEEGLRDIHLDESLIKDGTMLWLVRGTANLNSPSKKNDLITRGEFEIALPFSTDSGKAFALNLKYKQIRREDGQRQAALSVIKLVDEFGFSVDVEPGFKDAIRLAHQFDDDDTVGIQVEDKIIPLKLRLTTKEFNDYQDFFQKYYAYSASPLGNTRTLSQLESINSNGGMRRASWKISAQNAVLFIIERTQKVIFTVGLTVAGIAALDHFDRNEDAYSANNPPTRPEAVTISGLRSGSMRDVVLEAYPYSEEQDFLFTVTGKDKQDLPPRKTYVLRNENNEKMYLDLKSNSSNRPIYVLRDQTKDQRDETQ